MGRSLAPRNRQKSAIGCLSQATAVGQKLTVAVRDENGPNQCLGRDIPVVGLIGGYDKVA